MDSHSVKTTEQTTLRKSTAHWNNSGRTITDPETTNGDRATDFTKTDQELYTKNTISPNMTTDVNYSSRSLEIDTSSDYVKSMTNLSTTDNIANPDFNTTTDSSVIPSDGTAATTTVNISNTATTGETTDPLTTTSILLNTLRNNYETSQTNTEINAGRRNNYTHTTMRFMDTTTSFPDTSHFTTSGGNRRESYSSSSQNHGVNKVTEYEKWFNETTTESTFDQTSLSGNATGGETGNVTIAEVSEGMQNRSETTEDPSVPITENVTTSSKGVVSGQGNDGKSLFPQ